MTVSIGGLLVGFMLRIWAILMAMNRAGVTRCLLAAVFFGASAPVVSLLSGEMPVLVLAGLLYVGAAVAVLPTVIRQTQEQGVTSRGASRDAVRQEWRPLLVAVVAGGAIGPALLVAGLARTNAASASILLNLELVATVFLAATIFREHLGRRVILGASLVALGGVVLVWQPGAEINTGALLIAGGCLAWGFDNGVTANIQRLSPEQVVFAKGVLAGGGNLLLGIILALTVSRSDLGQINPWSILAAVATGAVGYGISITLWVKGARDLGAARGQVIFATAPFIGALVAWIVLREAATASQLIAAGFAITGVVVSLDSAHEHDHEHALLKHDHEHSHDSHHEHSHDVLSHERDHERGREGVDNLVTAGSRHSHAHEHEVLRHSHPHVPDLHHRHQHDH